MEWVLIGGGLFILAVIADRIHARRGSSPLSKMRPEIIKPEPKLGQETTDLELMEKTNAENSFLSAVNGANGGRGGNMNLLVPRLKTKPRQKDGPSK